MSDDLKKVVKGGIDILSEFFPGMSQIYFPLLYGFIVWVAKRPLEWKIKILEWKVWIDPGWFKEKPDIYILNFFRSQPALAAEFQKELKAKNMNALRTFFHSLYPIFDLEDPFLIALFNEELDAGDYRKISKVFSQRILQARRKIDSLKNQDGLFKRLESLAREAGSLNLEFLRMPETRRAIQFMIRQNIENEDE